MMKGEKEAKSLDVLPISVVIPAYNASKYLRQTIESVRSQTAPVAEIIVVNDGSTDDTGSIAKELGAVVIDQENKGLAKTRNTGILHAGHEWIALLDADDIWMPTKIEEQWKAVGLCQDISIVTCDHADIDDSSAILKESYLFAEGSYYKDLNRTFPAPDIGFIDEINDDFWKIGNFFSPSTILFRKSLGIELGLFDQGLKFVEDVEFFLRILAQSQLAVVEKPLMHYRIHEENWSKDELGMTLGYLAIVEMLKSTPEIYPKGAFEAWAKVVPEKLCYAGILKLKEGNTSESRSFFAKCLRSRFSIKVLFLWLLSFFPDRVIGLLYSIKKLSNNNISS